MAVALALASVLEEVNDQDGSMAQLDEGPRHSGVQGTALQFPVKSQRSLQAQTSWDIRMGHKPVCFRGKVAIDW